MRRKRKIFVSVALLTGALAGVTAATAQSGGASDQATANYEAALTAAFSPGYWMGRFEERDESGKITDSDETPSCIGADEGSGFAGTMVNAIEMLKSAGTCTTTGGGLNSLNYKLVCSTASGQTIEYVSTGSFKPGKSAELTVAIGPSGSTRSMHVTMTRVSDTCPQ